MKHAEHYAHSKIWDIRFKIFDLLIDTIDRVLERITGRHSRMRMHFRATSNRWRLHVQK